MSRVLVPIAALLVVAIGVAVWLLSESESSTTIDTVANDGIATAGDAAAAADRAALDAVASADAAARTATAQEPVASESLLAWLGELGIVTGRLVDVEGKPVANLALRTLPRQDRSDTPGSLTQNPERAPRPSDTTTDAGGRFELRGLCADDTYVLIADPAGARIWCIAEVVGPALGATTDLGDLVLRPNVTIAGRVVDARGSPVADAIVAVPDSGEPRDEWLVASDAISKRWVPVPLEVTGAPPQADFTPKTRTDAAGRFTLTGMFRADDVLVVRAQGRACAVFARDSDATDVGDLVLPRGENVRGTLATAAAALGSATVYAGTMRTPPASAQKYGGYDPYAWPLPDPLRLRRMLRMQPRVDAILADPIGEVGADGRFEIQEIELPALVFARTSDGRLTDVVRVDAARDAVELALTPTYDLTLRVRSRATTPIAGTQVRIFKLLTDENAWDSVLRGGSFDAAAAVDASDPAAPIVRGLAPGRYWVSATADGHGIASAACVIADADVSTEFELPLEAAIDVRVKAPDGSPVRGAHVNVWPTTMVERQSTRKYGAITDAEGVARVGYVGAFPVRVVARHPRFAVGELTAKDEVQAVDLTLQRGGTLVAKVRRADAPPTKRWAFMLNSADEPARSVHRIAAVDAAGDVRFERLPPGNYDAMLCDDKGVVGGDERPGIQPAPFFMGSAPKRTARVDADAVTEVTLDEREAEGYIGPTARVSGHVLLNGGLPPPNLVVVLRLTADWSSTRKATIDASGAYAFADAPAGVVRVGVADSGNSDQWFSKNIDEREVELVAGGDERVDFDLRTGQAHGMVVFADDGSPALGAEVEVQSAPTKNAASSQWIRRSVITGARGEYEITLLREGSYRVSAEHGSAPKQSLAESFEIKVGSDFALPAIRLKRGVVASGTLVDAAGKVSAAYACSLWCMKPIQGYSSSSREGTLDPKTGAFRFEGVAPGRCRLTAYGSDVEFDPVEFDVPETGATDLVLTLSPHAVNRAAVSGRIELPSADAPRIVSLVFWKDRSGSGVDVNPLTLAFEASWLEAGSFRIEFSSVTSAKYESVTLDVPPEGLKDLVLKPKLAPKK